MSRCDNKFAHVNAFVNLNGVPYLLAEYLDRSSIVQLDRSFIKSDIFIDQSESMRSIINISVDDIGVRGSDELPAIVGNTTKQMNFIRTVESNAMNLDHELDVLRRGIVLRINYQLESAKDNRVIRSMVEDLRITDRNYFLDINPRNVDDNAIVVNFNGTQVSTVNEFTHGRERMYLRITGIQMLYEALDRAPKMPRIKNTMLSSPNMMTQNQFNNFRDYYNYHDEMQNHHFMGECRFTEDPNVDVIPPSWTIFNRFYHFDHAGSDVVLHPQEINDPMAKVTLIPCGNIKVNRVFMINPCHRLIFKFSIWKNDVVIFHNTVKIAQALKAPLIDGWEHDHKCDCDHGCNHPIDIDRDAIDRELHRLKHQNMRQDQVINKMMNMMEDMYSRILELTPTEPGIPEDPDKPPIIVEPPNTSSISSCKCNCVDDHKKLDQEISDLKNEIEDVRNDDAPIPVDRLEDIVNETFGI